MSVSYDALLVSSPSVAPMARMTCCRFLKTSSAAGMCRASGCLTSPSTAAGLTLCNSTVALDWPILTDCTSPAIRYLTVHVRLNRSSLISGADINGPLTSAPKSEPQTHTHAQRNMIRVLQHPSPDNRVQTRANRQPPGAKRPSSAIKNRLSERAQNPNMPVQARQITARSDTDH